MGGRVGCLEDGGVTGWVGTAKHPHYPIPVLGGRLAAGAVPTARGGWPVRILTPPPPLQTPCSFRTRLCPNGDFGKTSGAAGAE